MRAPVMISNAPQPARALLISSLRSHQRQLALRFLLLAAEQLIRDVQAAFKRSLVYLVVQALGESARRLEVAEAARTAAEEVAHRPYASEGVDHLFDCPELRCVRHERKGISKLLKSSRGLSIEMSNFLNSDILGHAEITP
jgi:hypothetical protein